MTVLSERSDRTPFASQGQAQTSRGLISNVALAPGSRSATLTVNKDDPYFFDHPLDHVPAMALVSGLLALARSSGIGDLDRTGLQMGLSLTLPSFCELEPVVQLETIVPISGEPRHDPDGKVKVRACQDGRVVCDGALTVHRALLPAAGPARAGAARFSQHVEHALVHRRRPENILIRGVVADSHGCTAAIRRPPTDHVLAGAGQAIRPEVLIDAARQFGTLICHAEHGAPLDTQFIMLGIEADIPCALRRRAYLRWRRTLASRGRSTMELEVVVNDPDGEPCGRIAFDYFGATPAAYQRLRGRKTPA